MKVGVISDIHGNAPALAAALEVLRKEGVEQLWFLGDLVGYYSFVNECADLLHAWDTVAVRGNHDQVLTDVLQGWTLPVRYRERYGSALERALDAITADTRIWLLGLPLDRRVKVGGRTIGMYHGAPWDPLEGRVYPDFADWSRFSACSEEVVLLGHTHYPLVRQVGGKLLLNPGSIGQARDRSGAAAFAVLNTRTLDCALLRAPYDASDVIRDVEQHDPHIRYLRDVLVR